MPRSTVAARLGRRRRSHDHGDPFAAMPGDEVALLAHAVCVLVAALPPLRLEQHARALHHFLADQEPLFGVPAGQVALGLCPL